MKRFSQFTLLIFLLSAPTTFGADKDDSACVILLHGLYRSGYSMKAVEWHLAADYHVVNISYPSMFFPIEELADTAVEKGLTGCRLPGHNTIHFVTHSMGGILVRQYLTHSEIPELGRVVMMGPPNQGSEVIDVTRDWPTSDLFAGEAGLQLGTDPDSVPSQLGPVDFELGVIAGTGSINFVMSAMLPGPNDGKVSVESTRVAGMNDFLIVDNSHRYITGSAEVIRNTKSFLSDGYFVDSLARSVALMRPAMPGS